MEKLSIHEENIKLKKQISELKQKITSIESTSQNQFNELASTKGRFE